MLLKGFFFDFISFRADIIFTLLLGLLSLGLWLRYAFSGQIKYNTRRLTLLGAVAVLCAFATAALYYGRLTRALDGKFYRVLGVTSNLLEVPDSETTFGVHWEAYVMLPEGVDKLKIRNLHMGVAAFWDGKVLELPPSSLDLGSDYARGFLGSGWSYNEQTQDKKHNFVWSAEDHSILYLGLQQEGPYQLRVRCVPYRSETSRSQELTAFVNGTNVGTVKLQAGWDWRTYSFELPRKILENQAPGVIQVRFQYSHVYPIKSRRTLAVSFDAVSLESGFKQGEESQQEAFDFVGPADLQAGLHRLTIKAQGEDAAAYLRLQMRQRGRLGFVPIARENIFPAALSESQIQKGWQAERFLLIGCISAKVLFLLLGTYFLFLSRRPTDCDVSASQYSFALRIHFIFALLVLTAMMYFSTGTLAPYANTLSLDIPGYPTVEPGCGYLYNGDYGHFRALFLMLDGAPKSEWGYSVVLRRILYNVLAYPFMKIWGHDIGGIVTNFLLTWSTFVLFIRFVARHIGARGAIVSMWLLAVYPGFAYYVGQPFLYSIIAPGCLCLYILLYKLELNERPSQVFFISLLVGSVFLGYDFIVFFGFSALCTFIFRKRYRQLPILLCGILLPSVVWRIVLTSYYGGAYASNNTGIYSTILKSYLGAKDYREWFELLKDVPLDMLENFLFSGFLFLPALFLLMVLLRFFFRHTQLGLPEVMLLVSVLLVFLLNNLAPPYEGWKMRGDGMARIYQPLFVVLLVFISRTYQVLFDKPSRTWLKSGLVVALVLAIVGNALVVLGPMMKDPLNVSSQVYWRFYKHSGPESLKMNMIRYGRKPLGICHRSSNVYSSSIAGR